MTDEAARALRAYEQRLQPRRARPTDAPAYEPPRRREAPQRAYGSRGRGEGHVRPPLSTHAGDGIPGRRTVEIRGQVAAPRRRAGAGTVPRFAAHPDRMALWAFLLGLFLVLMAVATAHAAV